MRMGEEGEEEEVVVKDEGEAERASPFGGECVVLLAPESSPPSPRAEVAWMVELVECRRGRGGAGSDEVRDTPCSS